MWTPKERAGAIAEHFRACNEEFGRITRRAALNFLAEDWHAAQADAVERIEMYERRVGGSHDLVFKVIRDRFGAPKTNTREDVMREAFLQYHAALFTAARWRQQTAQVAAGTLPPTPASRRRVADLAIGSS